MHFFELMRREVMRSAPHNIYGEVVGVNNLTVSIAGICKHITIGERCFLLRNNKPSLACEIISMDSNIVTAMPFGSLDGVGVGNRVSITHSDSVIYPHPQWLGRTIDAFGYALDGKGALPIGDESLPIKANPPPAHHRRRMGHKFSLGIRSIDSFIPCCQGQRLGIFAGSGVGKSILLSMIAKHNTADVIVVGLIGERGREVKEFIESSLGEEGMKKCVLVVATSDEPALCRKQAAFTAMTVAEYFRKEGKDVLLLLDSITRFAMALREIGLSVGEPPTTKGYPPSVFSELPKLLERAGSGSTKLGENGKYDGNITGLFTILVEGDDHNEPISDAIRGILDGHIVLDRTIAQRGRYPSVDILQSVSRALPACNNEAENKILNLARGNLSIYHEMSDLISLGAYRKGNDEKIDRAIGLNDAFEDFFNQAPDEKSTTEQAYEQLAKILGMPSPYQQAPTSNPTAPIDNKTIRKIDDKTEIPKPLADIQARRQTGARQNKQYEENPENPAKILSN